MAAAELAANHRRRRRDVWRSAGWPCRDLIGLDLLAAGLLQRVALEMQRAVRVVWRGLSLRAPLAGESGCTRSVTSMPDVFSIRHTTVEDCVEPVVHEIKVSRADLLSNLRRPEERRAYQAPASQCWYVIRAGIAGSQGVPGECGLMETGGTALAVLRRAPPAAAEAAVRRMDSLARAPAEPAVDIDRQAWLGATAGRVAP